MRVKDLRLRQKVLRGIEDLTYLARKLPEDQLVQVFSLEKIRPLFEAILESPYMREKTWGQELAEDDLEKQRLRLVVIYYHLWGFLKARIPHLAPDPYNTLLETQTSRLAPAPDLADYALRIEAETLHSKRKITLREREKK